MEKRKFLQQSTFLIMSKVVRNVAIFFTGVVLTRYFSKAEYGTFSQIILISTTLSLILGGWLVKSLYYFVPTSQRKKEIALQTNLFLFGLGMIIGLLVWLFRVHIADWFQNPALVSLAIYVSLYMLMLTLSLLGESFFISVDKAHVLALINIIFSVVYLSAVSYTLIEGATLDRLMLVIILLFFAMDLFILITMIRLPGTTGRLFRWEIFSSQLRYAAPLLLSSFTVVMGRQVDKFIIATVFPTTDFAVYFRGALELPVIIIITYTISNMLLPKFVQLYKDDLRDDFVYLWHKAIKKTIILIFPLFVLFLFISQSFITFLYTDRYANSVPVFRIYLLTMLIQVTAYDCIVQATGKTRGVFYASLLNVISNLTASLILIRLVGPAGAAMGLVFGQVISTLYYLTHIGRTLRRSFAQIFPWLHALKIFTLALAVGATCYAISLLELASSKLMFMIIYSVVFLLLYTVLIFKLNFLQRENFEFMKLSLFSRSR